jgi:hypothetical protein
MVAAAAAGANGFVPMVLVERGQHGVGAGVPAVGWLILVGPALLLAGAFQEASVIFVMTPSVSRTTTPMVDAVAVGAEVAWPMVLVQRGQHGVGAGLPVVGWFSVGAFLPVAEAAAETKASGNSVRRTQNSWGRFCGGWTAFVHWGVAGKTCGARVGFGVVVGMVLLACGFLWHVGWLNFELWTTVWMYEN